MKTDAEIRAKWKEVLDRPRKNPHVIDTGALVIEVVRWAESGLTQRALDGAKTWGCWCGADNEEHLLKCWACGSPRK